MQAGSYPSNQLAAVRQFECPARGVVLQAYYQAIYNPPRGPPITITTCHANSHTPHTPTKFDGAKLSDHQREPLGAKAEADEDELEPES